MRQLVALVLFIGIVSPPIFQGPSSVTAPVFAAQTTGGQTTGTEGNLSGSFSPGSLSPEQIQNRLEGPIDADEIVATSAWASSSGIVDWLGPLAPVALSPFFGVTCLSGLALWGPEWATDNAVLGSAGPLRNEWLFVTFLLLTLLTSLPRLTKVSKPFAQAVDRLETYAVIVILLAIKITMSYQGGDELGDQPQVAMVQLGVVSFTADTLLAVAMAINVLVINSVKFFFEFLVWLTPVPFLDAIFEVCNKTLCATLMAIYAWSPTVATVINLVILLVALLMLRWISRRVRFYRTMVLDPILAKLWTGFGKPARPELIVFPRQAVGPFKAKSRLRMTASKDESGGWKLSEANWWMPTSEHTLPADVRPRVRCGWVMNQVEIGQADGTAIVLTFSRRYNRAMLSSLLQELGLDQEDAEQLADETIATQFA